MKIEIAKWKNSANSPLLLAIDDLANIYVKQSSSKDLEIGEDWGHYASLKNSMWDFLQKNLLERFPEIRTTFFLVTKKRAPIVKSSPYSYAEAIDANDGFSDFLRQLHANDKVELAYHGTTHGEAGERVEDFVQEWDTYGSLEEALERINEGKELFKKVLGEYPQGGKYCGYKEGKFGKESIEKSHFKWWSFHQDDFMWDKNSTDERLTYDVNYIQGVVNIPTTVDASNLSLRAYKQLFTRKYLKSLYLYFKEHKTVERHLESLYNNKQVIAVYEHTSPYMSNKDRQYPNIVTDIQNLNIIFSYLKDKDVWYATANEVADYFIARTTTNLEQQKRGFLLTFSDEAPSKELTLVVERVDEKLALYDEDKNLLKRLSVKPTESYVTYCFEANRRYFIDSI